VAGLRDPPSYRLWNVAASRAGQPRAWQVVLGVKISVVFLAGLAAYWHQRSTSRTALAAWGAIIGVASLAAVALGVLLAG